MTQHSKLNLLQCFLCQSNEFEQITLNQNLLDASDFYEVGAKSIGFSYVLTTCKKCGHSAIQTENPCLFPTRKYDFIKYGEPIEHYPEVSTVLRTLNLDFNDISLHTFSYKDFQLANFLAKDLEIYDVNLNDHVGCSDDWLPDVSSERSKQYPKRLSGFISEIENSKKSHQIILITRIFDHVANYDLVQEILDLISPTRHIVFDLNNYDRLFELDTLEFIWNERRNLLRRSHLESILERSNLKYSIFAYESQSVSPTLTGVISERLDKSGNSLSPHVIELSAPLLVEKLIALRQRWQDRLGMNHKLGIIGASHKGISLAQFVLVNHAQYSLHDDKEALKGRTPPVGPPLNFHSVSGFDFSEYTHIAITTTLVIAAKIIPKLRASGYTGEILDFDCRKLD
jgi:predicted nucleic-acid-binding Zn-ribbon protein